jgi:iron(III) transport system substrate-binding protein
VNNGFEGKQNTALNRVRGWEGRFYAGFSKSLTILLLAAVILTACAPAPTRPAAAGSEATPGEAAQPSGRLVVYSGRSEPLIQPVIAAFNAQYPGVEVLLKSGRNSELANALIEEQNNPQADVFITTEVFTVQALAQAGVFQSYRPAAADGLPAYAVGPENQWMGLTSRARVIMYNTELVSPDEVPQSIFDLIDPRWRGQIAAAGSSNGSMQAQVAAMRQLLGEEATEEWLRGLLANEVVFFGGHTDVRKAVGAGEFKIGLVNHYYYHLQVEEGSPVGIVYPDQGTDEIGLFLNFTSAGILKGSRNLPAAQALIDFLLSTEGQQLFAQLNYEYPLIASASLHEAVRPLDGLRLAQVDVAQAVRELDATFDLMERIGLP